MNSLFSFRGRTTTSNSQPPQSRGSDTKAPQELDEKILYQTGDRNPEKAKEPRTDIITDEMDGSGQWSSAPPVAKTPSQGSRRGTGGANEQPSVEGFYALKERLVESQKKLGNAESWVSKLQGENKKLGEKIAEMDRTFRQNPGYGYDTQRATALKELESSNRQKDERIRELEKQVLLAQRLVEIKTTELSKAQAYTTKPDDLPGSDIIDMVKLLNSEIFNTATAISDLFERSAKADYEETLAKREFFDVCRNMANECIGKQLYVYNCQVDESMVLRRQAVNPEDWIPLQLALQCALVGWCSYVAGIIGPVPGDGEALQRCYEKIRVREEQSVSARWRVMVAGANKNIECSSSDIAVTRVMAVLCISGLSLDSPDYRNVEKRVRERMRNLEKQLQKLKTCMHEGIVSGDMELINVGIGEAYKPSSMIDAHMEANIQTGVPLSSLVLCTVGLGLRKIVMQKGEDVRYTLLKPPEVALVDVLENFVTPGDHVEMVQTSGGHDYVDKVQTPGGHDYVDKVQTPGGHDYVDKLQTSGDHGYTDMVRRLNSEISNTATTIIDLFKRGAKAEKGEIEDEWQFFDDCSEMAEGCIGEKLYVYNCQVDGSLDLRGPVNPKNWIPLQLALQCVLVGWCSYVIGEALQRDHKKIPVREEQSVSGRGIAGATNVEYSSIDIAVTRVMAVLCISGLSSVKPDHREVEKRVRERMCNMEMLFQNEGIVSGDVELINVGLGKAYDPSSMIDVHMENVRAGLPQSGSVLCTVALGLRKIVMQMGEDVRYTLLMPPEVALVDVLENFKTPEDRGYDT